MGQYEAELKLIVTKAANIRNDLGESIEAIPQAAEVLRDFADAFSEIGRNLGFTGIAEKLASDIIEEANVITAKTAAAVGQMERPLRAAYQEVKSTETRYEALPETDIPIELRLAVLAGSTIVVPGLGFLGGMIALDQYQQHLNREREKEAEKALEVLAETTFASSMTLYKEAKAIDPPPKVDDDSRFWGGSEERRPKLPSKPDIDGTSLGPGADVGLGDSGSWDSPTPPADGAPTGGAAAGAVGAGAAAGLAAGLGKLGSGSGNSGLTPGVGASGGRGAGAGAIGVGSRVSADSANVISRLSSGSGGSSLNGGLASGRSGLSGLGSGAGGLGGAGSGAGGLGGAGSGSGVSGIGGVGSAGAGRAAGTGSAGAGGAAGGQGMMMGGGGGGAGGDKDKSRGSLGYRAPKIEAAARGRVRAPTGDAGSRADFPESQPQSEPRN